MKKISLILMAAMVLASCQQKELKSSTSNKRTLEAPPASAEPAKRVVMAETQKNYEVATEKTDESGTYDQRKEEVDNIPLTLSLAGTVGSSEKDEKPSTNTITVSNQPETKVPSQIIRNAIVNFQADNADSSHERIAQALTGFKAYFDSDRRWQDDYSVQQVMMIRVPAANFDKLMDVLLKESIYTTNKNITADDVTAEYVDIQTRLKSKKEVEKRYIELLGRAQKVSDILEVENNLRVIREEIESTEGRLKLLRDQVAFSTINLTIIQKLETRTKPGTAYRLRMRAATIRGWKRMENLSLTVLAAWPFIFIALPFMAWFVIRRRRTAALKA